MSILCVRNSAEFSEALEKAVSGDLISMAKGDYRLKSVIDKAGISIEGAGAHETRILWSDAALDRDEQGLELVTFRTYTLAVTADHVHMRALSVINDAGHPELKGQEVALTVYGDEFTMEDCILSSTQDTLFLGPLPADLIRRYEGFLPDALRQDRYCRQYFKNCLIEGSVDFIFGCGEAVFDHCELRSVFDVRGSGYVAAPAHALSQKRGFLFRDSLFTAEDTVARGSIFLARPWRDYGLACFEDCSYGPHISPAGFDPWNDTDRDKTARFYETPALQGRVPWVREI